MEYRERQPAPAAAVELAAGREDLWPSLDVAATTAGRREPPPLTHEDNRGFLQMLKEKKERYVLAIVCSNVNRLILRYADQ